VPDGLDTHAHAKYSGSAISLIRKCPGKPRYAAAIGRSWDDNADAKEGRIVHELIQISLDRGIAYALTDLRWNAERAQGVYLTVDYVNDLKKVYRDIQVYTEQKVYFPQSVVRKKDCVGKADVICISREARRGWLIDYKNGIQTVPDPAENDQLWFYATAAFWETPLAQFTKVIIQPNGIGVDPIREHTSDLYELIEFQAEIEALIQACEMPDAQLVAGPWCAQCSVGAECLVREKAAIAAITGDPNGNRASVLESLDKPEALNVSRWVEILSMSDAITKWLKDVKDAAYLYALKGGDLPGYKIVQARGRREWVGTPEETAEGLSALTGRPASDFLKTSVVGITDAERAVSLVAARSPNPDGLRDSFASLAVKVESQTLSLAPSGDPRPAYNAAASTFNGVVPDTLINA
jgi:hypothetical protein